jgi:hypothetical protein
MMRNVLLLAVLSLTGFFLSGCSADFNTVTPSPAGISIQGRVYGGQQPVVGAKVYLYAAGTGGYGTASASMLTTAGGYVTSGAGGSFSISGDYATCTANEYLYLYSTGGDGGGGANSAITMMAPLGLCTSGGTLLSTTPDIWMDEVTTVVTAYTLAGWMNAPLQLATDNTAAALGGLNTAFATASRLENIAAGTTYATTPQPTTYGFLTGTVPQANIDSLANSIAACVNTAGPTSTACDKLFSNALSGGTTGTKPSDTATAIVNIAHNPTANVGNVFNVAGTTVPYQPTLSTAPVDWTLAVPYTSNLSTYGDTAGTLTIDSLGNLAFLETQGGEGDYAVYDNSLSSSEVNGNGGESYGAAIFDTGTNSINSSYEQVGTQHMFDGSYTDVSKTSGSRVGQCNEYYVHGNAESPPDLEKLAFDHAGYLWALSTSTNTVFQVTNDIPNCGGTVNLYTASLNAATDLAADSLGNMWFANNGAGNLLKMNTSGTATVYTNGGFSGISNLAVGAVGEVIATNASTSLTTLATDGTVTTECTGAAKLSLAVDGANRRWMVNTNNQIETCAAGDAAATTLSSAVNATGPHAIGVDGAGDVWVEAAPITELIGVATPPVLPLATAVATAKIGTRP